MRVKITTADPFPLLQKKVAVTYIYVTFAKMYSRYGNKNSKNVTLPNKKAHSQLRKAFWGGLRRGFFSPSFEKGLLNAGSH